MERREEIREMLRAFENKTGYIESNKRKKLEYFWEIRDILKDFYKLETVVNGGNPVVLEKESLLAEMYMPNEDECIHNYSVIHPSEGDIILTIKCCGAYIDICVDRLEFKYFCFKTYNNKKLSIEDEEAILEMLNFDVEEVIYEKLKEYKYDGIVYSKAK